MRRYEVIRCSRAWIGNGWRRPGRRPTSACRPAWRQCLAATGYQAEALRAYQLLRERLADELGIDPGPELREAHARALRQQVETGRPAMPPEQPTAQPAPSIRPAQLPADLASFGGRVAELASLAGMLVPDGADDGPPSTRVVMIAGMAGVGKTTLAVRWAHMVADRFPDGQLYVNLRGFDPAAPATSPGEALRGFLDAFEVAPQRIPANPDAQAALYRSLLSGRRVLVLLDNARDAEQVRPLLPGSAGCLVIVTSRNELSGLVAADGAIPVALESLTGAEARDVLSRRLRPEWLSAEPGPVAEIISRCAGLPLALAVVSAQAVTRARGRAGAPAGHPLAAVAGELRTVQAGLDAFAGPDPNTDLRAVFSWSYQSLAPAAARVFQLLGLHPGPDVSLPAVASLAGLPIPRTRALMAELRLAHLVIEPAPGRYTLHDLLRAYATELAGARESAEGRRAAYLRMFDHYLHTAYAAARMMAPTRAPITIAAPAAGVAVEPIAGAPEALDWFTVQRPVLLAMVGHAAAAGFDQHAHHLPWTMHHFFQWQGHYLEWIATNLTGLVAAERLADRAAQAWLHRSLAGAYAHLERGDEADAALRRALSLHDGLDDPEGEAQAHRALAFVHGRQRRYEEALHHSQRALDLFAGSGHRSGQANALNEVGWYLALLGDHDRAVDHCERALILNQELGNQNGEAATWDSLGYAHHHRGDYQQAVACYRRAIDLHHGTQDRFRAAETFTHLAETHEAADDLDAARAAWQEAAAILAELGLPDLVRVRGRLARLAAAPASTRVR
jgi:tetratricopeptide (TPR) repeat protein